MTTIVVVKKAGQVVIAGDTLTTFGSVRLGHSHDGSPEKLLKHGESYFGISGSAAHQLVLENLLKRHPDFSFNSKEEIFESFRKIHPILKEEAFLNPKEEDDDPYESSQLTALIANPYGIFGVYSMREVFEFEKFWASGSGRDFALGAMFTVYSGKATQAASAEDVALAGIHAGVEYDTGTALPMNLVVIDMKPKSAIPAPAQSVVVAENDGQASA